MCRGLNWPLGYAGFWDQGVYPHFCDTGSLFLGGPSLGHIFTNVQLTPTGEQAPLPSQLPKKHGTHRETRRNRAVGKGIHDTTKRGH